MMKKIAIIGHGYVGQALDNFFKDHFTVVIYDPKYPDADRAAANGCDLAVICVPTPPGRGGRVDVSLVLSSVGWLKTPLVLIKSTIPPGTTDRLIKKTGKKIAFSPEYLGEGKYVVPWWKDKGYPHPTDMKYHDFMIIGGERPVTGAILEFFKTVWGPEPRYIQTTARAAELTKYMENAWLATKVTFCNEFFEIAKAFGVDYDELRELWLLDGRVGRSHTLVFRDNRGFGGKCLPKDVTGLVKAAEAAGYEPKLVKAVLEVNKKIRKE